MQYAAGMEIELIPDKNKDHCNAFGGSWTRQCFKKNSRGCRVWGEWNCKDRYEYQQGPIGGFFKLNLNQWCQARGGHRLRKGRNTKCSVSLENGLKKYLVEKSINKGFKNPRESRWKWYRYPRKEKITINPEKMGNCMWAVIKNYSGNLSFDKDKLKCRSFPLRKIYSDLDDYYNSQRVFQESYKNADFFSYLAAYAGSLERRCDYETGRENNLRYWILAQEDNSITPIKIFEKSLILNEGNVWDALLTIHQLIRNEVRWNRDCKLLSGLVNSPSVIDNLMIALKDNFIFTAGEWGKYIISWDSWGKLDNRKTEINRRAGSSAVHLLGYIINSKTDNGSLNYEKCQSLSSYIYNPRKRRTFRSR